MARILKSMSGGFIPDLDGNVGSQGGNLRSDVAAVQFALLVLSKGVWTPIGPASGSLSVPGQGTIVIDGFYGPQTAAYIDAYQAKRIHVPSSSGGSLPTPNGNFGNSRRTEWRLNLLVEDIPTSMGNYLDLVRTDSRCPPFLKDVFIW